MKIGVKKLIRDEEGQALVLALILLVVGGLIAASLLGYMGTGLITGQVYENKMYELYAADAGIEDALCQIKNDQLPILFPNPPAPPDGYDEYDYSTPWSYDLHDPVNDKDVHVTIENVWMPMGIDPPDAATARQIIEEGELIIAGGASNPEASTYEIKISYLQGCEGPGGAKVKTIGIWLPPGFEYVEGSSDLEEDSEQSCYSVPNVVPHKGSCAVVWDFVSPVTVSGFPESFTFQYWGSPGQIPGAAVSWIVTTEGYTWDADVKVYKILSVAGSTEIETYTTKGEIRELGSAISGDYIAIGNSLMLPDPNNGSNPANDWRSRLLKESSATIPTDSIPAGATIKNAYLYWSGWIDHYYWYYENGWHWSWSANPTSVADPQDAQVNLTGLVYDPDNLNQMVEGWTDGSGKGAKVNTVNFNGSDITTHDWQVWPKTNDSSACWYYTCFYDATSIVKPLIEEDGVSTFTFGHATSLINQNPPRPNFPRMPGAPGSDHTSPGYSFTLYDSNGNPMSDYYTGYPLGTPAHRLPSENYEDRYHASYAGWSLVIIYSSPETKGHQLYLYDIINPGFTFKESYPHGASESNPDFDGDGNPGGHISGFLVPQQITGETDAAKMTCFVGEGDYGKTGDSFKVTGPSGTEAYLLDNTPGCVWNDVWNSRSVGVAAPGVDIDSFYVTWDSNILMPGDTWAQVDLPTVGDGFTLSYIILSFRSEITSGGIMGYLIR